MTQGQSERIKTERRRERAKQSDGMRDRDSITAREEVRGSKSKSKERTEKGGDGERREMTVSWDK